MYLTPEKAKEHVLSRASALRAAADFLPTLRRIAEEYDGKCYNRRFENALRDAASGSPLFPYVKKGCSGGVNYIMITCHYTSPDGHCNYGESYTISGADLIDGKRIDCKSLMEVARVQREHHLRDAAELEESLSHVDEWKTQLEYLKRQIDTIVNRIPSSTADAFDLRYSVRR